MSQEALFPGLEPEPDDVTTADRRRTLRARAALEAGRHPANGRMIDPNPEHTCGNCAHLKRYSYHNATYLKCPAHRLGESHSAASDMRASWPACPLWTEDTQ